MKAINLNEKFSLFNDQWSPKILAEVNGQLVKLAKLQGDFVWHDHAEEDELFFVVKGTLFIDVKGSQTIELNAGEMTVIPKTIEHRPRTGKDEVWVLLFEPKSTLHTGEVEYALTDNNQKSI